MYNTFRISKQVYSVSFKLTDGRLGNRLDFKRALSNSEAAKLELQF